METSDTARPPWVRHALAARWDIVLGICAFLFSLPFLTFPLAHDQGLYAYVAREWVQHGSIPYRDVYDHKTPGIYIIHAITIILFGSTAWGIRLADSGCIIAMGLVAARLATPKGTAYAPGFRGLCCLIASVLHYGFFTYWDTAQSEIWYATFGMGAVAAAWHAKEDRRAQIIGGVLAGVAVVIKPPALWFAIVAAGVVLIRARKAGGGAVPMLKAIVTYGASAAIPIGLVLFYFGVHGALPAMYDIVVGANSYYIVHESNIDSFSDIFVRTYDFLRFAFPFTPFLLLAIPIFVFVGIKKKLPDLRNRYALNGALFVACLGCVIMQQKFYVIHWIVVIAPLSALLGNLAWDATSFASAYFSRVKGARTLATFAAALLLGGCFELTLASTQLWGYVAKIGYMLATGKITHEQYEGEFHNDVMGYYEIDVENVSAYIAAHSSPTDTICVRGFNPEIYLLANRRYEGRFFWSNFLVDQRRAYRRPAYLAEDREVFMRTKPRYVVTIRVAKDSLDAAEWYLPLGYEVRKDFGFFILLERVTSEKTDAL